MEQSSNGADRSEEEVIKAIIKGEKFATEEVDKIMISHGVPEDMIKGWREKGLTDKQILGKLRFIT
jgi:hypothetical protein